MQSSDKYNTELEIEKVVMELDRNRILSEEDRIELHDYFFNEMEYLQEGGLNEQEALIIAKKRFGVLDDVREDYQKVKPGFDLLKYGIIGVVAFSIIKIFAISVDLTSKLIWFLTFEIDKIFALMYYSYDLPFRILLILAFGYFTNKVFKKVHFKSLASFWHFPIIYLIFEFLNNSFYALLPGCSFNSELIWHMSLNSNGHILNYFLAFFIMIFTSYKMYKMKILDMEYV